MIDVVVDDPAWTDADPAAALAARTAAVAALAHEGADGDLTVLLADDARLQALNARFRGKDAPTNVLAFPAAGGADWLGDIALAFGVCAREAEEQGKPLSDHLQHLTAHGVLHLLGYDHQTSSEAEAMEACERAILKGLGVPDPYA